MKKGTNRSIGRRPADRNERRLPGAPAWIADLEKRAARLGMRELLVRAHLHRARLGGAASLEVARALAAEIDNPALEAALSS